MLALIQAEETAQALRSLSEQAPMVAALVAVVAAMLGGFWKLLSTLIEHENARDTRTEERQKARDADLSKRHDEYFQHLHDIQDNHSSLTERTNEALDRNTSAFSAFSETNRAVAEALRERRREDPR